MEAILGRQLPSQEGPVIDDDPESADDMEPARQGRDILPTRSYHSLKSNHTPRSTSTYSDDSDGSVDIPAIPSRATHARLASASSLQLLSHPSTQSLLPKDPTRIPDSSSHPPQTPTTTEGEERPSLLPDTAAAILDRSSLNPDDIARLPWAEPPPRISAPPSPARSGGARLQSSNFPISSTRGSMLDPESDLPPLTPPSAESSRTFPGGLHPPIARTGSNTPSYSFLASDPSEQPSPLLPPSRRSSRSSITSSHSFRSRPNHLQLPITPQSSLPPSLRAALHEDSSDVDRSDDNSSPGMARSHDPNALWPHSPADGNSALSDMADVGPSPLPASMAGDFSGEEPYPPVSAATDEAQNSGTRSLRSSIASAIRQLSSRSRSNRSKSVRGPTRNKSTRSVRSTRSGKRSSESTIGHSFGNKRWDWDVQVANSGLGDDAGTEILLDQLRRTEDMMDLLQLVGRATVLERMLRSGKRVSNATIRLGPVARSPFTSLRRRLTSSAKTSSPSAHHSRLSASSRPPSRSTRTPRSSQSLRRRLTRRLNRKSSQEDIFTELDSDEDDPSMFPTAIGRPSGDEIRSAGPAPTPDVSPEHQRPTEAAVRDVIVFPERLSRPPPPPPEKDVPLSCTTVMCIEPSPTSLGGMSTGDKGHDVEKATRGVSTRQHASVRSEAEVRQSLHHRQSPHLGHRSPNWRNRQSVLSYISTGTWDDGARRRWWIAIAAGCLIIVVLLVGLLAGLLARRKG